MSVLTIETIHCPTCGKNLKVIKQSQLVHHNGKTYCSKYCCEKDQENLESFRVTRVLGSRSPFKAQSKRGHR